MKFNELSHMMQKPEPKPDTYEAGMALNQLLKIGTHAIKIHNMIDDHAEMESWVAKKIDLASNYVKSVHGYTAGQKAGTYDDDGMSEGTDTPATDKEIKMAKGIAFDKRNKDNMSKATSTIEKVKKGLSQQPDVADALKTANEDVGYPRPLDGEVAVKQFAKNNPDTKFLLVKKSNGKFRVSYSMDITPGGHKGPGEPSSTMSGGTNEFNNANDAIEAGKKDAADYHKERMAQLKEPREEEPIHPLYGDWGTDPEDWSDTHVQNNEDIIIAIAKGKIPPRPPTISGYMDEQNDQWPEGVEGGKYDDDQIVSMIEDTIGYECRGLGYDYFSRITFGEEKGMYKPTPEMIKDAQEIVKDPEFAKARARNRGQAESVSEDAGDEQKWMNYAKFWKFVNEIFKDKAEEDISDQFISATTVDEEPSYSMSKELMQRQLKKQNTPFKINIDADLDEFSNELNGRYEDETDMAKMKQAAIEIIKTGSTQIEPVKNAGTLSTYVQEDAGEGHMSKSQLYQTAKMSIELLDMINKGDDLEGWVQTKLNLAADYLQAVYHYEDYQKLNPYREELDGSLMQKHAGVIQKHLDEILSKETKTADVDTKPGMMRILKKKVNEVEKEIAKENRKETNEESYIKPYVSMYRGKDGKMVYDVLDKHGNSAYKSSDERVARFYLKKNYDKLKESGILYRAGVKKYGKAGMKAIQSAAGKGASHQEIGKIKDQHLNDAQELEEGIKEWGKRLAMAGVIVAGLAGVNSINDAIDNSIPAVNAMNTALEMAQDSGNDELAKMIEKDLSDAKVRLSSGKDLGHVAGLQDKYTKFMNTEGMAYESKLAVNLKQRLK